MASSMEIQEHSLLARIQIFVGHILINYILQLFIQLNIMF